MSISNFKIFYFRGKLFDGKNSVIQTYVQLKTQNIIHRGKLHKRKFLIDTCGY